MISFRSLPIAVMLSTLDSAGKRDRAIAVISAATLFGIAHINLFTLQVTWFQVCYAFVLGIFYGYTFIRFDRNYKIDRIVEWCKENGIAYKVDCP